MNSTNPASAHRLIRPSITEAQAAQIAREHFGVKGSASELGSNQDRNFTVTEKSGKRWVLRVDNVVFEETARQAQHEAIAAYLSHGVRVPAVVSGKNGEHTQRAGEYAVRLFEFMSGPSLVDEGYLAPVVRREFGVLVAQSVTALADLSHPGLDREHQWDMRRAHQVVTELLPAVTVPALSDRLLGVSAAAEQVLATLEHNLSVQAIHGDLTDDNVACERGDDGRLHPYAILDFGDLALGWRVAELAVACASLLHHDPARPLSVLDAITAYHEVQPLTAHEARALWPLIVQRAAVLVVSGWNQLAIDGDNAYARDRIAGEQTIFEAATSISLDEGIESVLAATGHQVHAAAPDTPQPAELVHGLRSAPLLDLGVESEHLNAGVWLEADAEERVLREALAAHELVILPYGTYRLTQARPNSQQAAATYAIHTEIVRAPAKKAEPVFAPITANVLGRSVDSIELETSLGILSIQGIRPTRTLGERVDRGETIGEIAASEDRISRVRLQLRRPDLNTIVPPFVTPERAPGWRGLAPDPAAILGIISTEQRDEAPDELIRRNKIFASAQERYFSEPPQIERGWRHHLVDTTGRVYVDMVNNVTGLGHGHPAIANAINTQIRVLNTNSRFLYRKLAEYSERLIELAPKGGDFDTVLLVNSGSEAVDLALRLAQAATGRKNIVALREAYHGWTMGSDAVTTSAFDNPYALGSRPDWVHIADIPNIHRGTHRGPDAGPKYVADLAADLKKHPNSVAGFICETVLGNAGGVTLPEGYLAGVYEVIRSQGGLCIADEVQVGFGRMGDTFWGVELSGAVPDIITIAKPMGNGYPIGGVITSKKIADALSSEGNFFSSAGGSPVSCAVGLAVLDTMRDEGLQENARVVGEHLKTRLEALAQKHALVGPIHGHGLYLGVELVRDRETLEPAAEEANAISERLRELGVIVLTTSERKNVLKMKPPLCLTRESADFVVDALDEVLTTGW